MNANKKVVSVNFILSLSSNNFVENVRVVAKSLRRLERVVGIRW